MSDLSPRNERFAVLVAAGRSQTDADLEAGYEPESRGTARSSASELASIPGVSERITQLVAEFTDAIGRRYVAEALAEMVTASYVRGRLVQEDLAASAEGQHAAAIRALELLGKDVGLWRETETPQLHLHAALDQLTPDELRALASMPLSGEADDAWPEEDPVALPPD